MTADASVGVPAAAEVRLALRQVRRTHSDRTVGDLLTDVYLLAFVGVLYGGGAAVSIQRHLAQPLSGPPGSAAARAWLVIGLLAVMGGVAWHGLRAVGPLVTTPAAQSWVLSTPVDRPGWLRLPLRALLFGSAVLGAVVGVFAGWAGFSRGSGALDASLSAVAGAGAATALAALAVAAQPRPAHVGRRWPVLALVLGLGVVTAAVVAGRARLGLVNPAVSMLVVAPLTVVAAVLTVRRARGALPLFDRAALGGGAQLAGAAVTAVVMMDPALLSGILTARRWRLAGTVHSRHLSRGPRWWVLLQADLIRQLRRRVDVLTYAALVLVPYAIAVFAPIAAGPARIVAAYLAVDRLAGGLRVVARTPAVRRLLGGTDNELRLIHLVVPGVGLFGWWVATSWVGAPVQPVVEVLLLAGILAAVYRTATRPPMSYDAGLADSPFGPIPTTLLRRVVRGPDLVAVLVLLDLFTSAGLR